MSVWKHHATLTAALALIACSSGKSQMPFGCQTNADCPSGYICVSPGCVLDVDQGSDAGASVDAGMPFDAGMSSDAGVEPDAGVDAGSVDAGDTDAGEVDAGEVDAGEPIDAGMADAGAGLDAGEQDAGATDAGIADDGGVDGGMALQDLAPAGDTAVNGPVDGISCETHEQFVEHIHAHLAIYVDGEQKLVPAEIGIGVSDGGLCYSWLHTHDESGIIHIESPVMQTFTLGNFFDIWGIPLSANQVGPAQGAVTAFVNGQQFEGDVTMIPLDAANYIQLDVGTPVVPAQDYVFPPGY